MKITIRGKSRAILEILTYIFTVSGLRSFFYKTWYVFHKFIYENTIKNFHFDEGKVKFYFHEKRDFERVLAAQKKEPMTQRWIKEMKPDEVLWDVGANVGIFSFLAAQLGVKVVAYEPLFGNYYAICRTLENNPLLIENIIVLPIALSSADRIEKLYIPCSEVGYSGVQFGRSTDIYNKDLSSDFHLNVLGLNGNTIQTLLPVNFSAPTHIKIDVDGIEIQILEGMHGVLSEKTVVSILVEVQDGIEKDVISQFLEAYGFKNSLEEQEFTIPENYSCKSVNMIFRRLFE